MRSGWRLPGRPRAAGSRRAEVLEEAYRPAITVDGHRVEVAANISAVPEAGRTVKPAVKRSVLLRTEFLFQDRTKPPDEDEQFEAYGPWPKPSAGCR